MGTFVYYREVEVLGTIRCIIAAAVLLVFGFAMAFSQNVFETGFGFHSLVKSLKDVISGNTWDLMWYLYMLTGLYLFMPVMSVFVKNSGKRDIQYILIILFV